LKPPPRPAEPAGQAVAKKNGFASLAEYGDASMNISMIMSGIDSRRRSRCSKPTNLSRKRKARGLVPDAPTRIAESGSLANFMSAATRACRPGKSSVEASNGTIRAKTIPFRRAHEGLLSRLLLVSFASGEREASE
jgi:hypothetical protein